MLDKYCSKCNSTKQIIEFAKNKSRVDGLSNWCKSCTKLYNQNYYKANQDSIKSKVAEFRKNNPGVISERKRQYHLENAEKIRNKVKTWRENNPEKRRAAAKRYSTKHKNYLALKQSAKRAKLRENGVFTLLPKEIRKIYNGPCFYCGSYAKMEADHVIPISKGGRHSIGNLVPACRKCNISKTGKLLIVWKYERKQNGNSNN